MNKQHPGIEGRGRIWIVAALCGIAAALASCIAAPLIVGGVAAGSTKLALDRRSVGMQVEDEEIEHRVDSAVYTRFPIEPVNMYITSYNRKALLTGQVPDEKTKIEVGDIASRVENVNAVVNELQIAPVSSASARAQDAFISSKVDAAMLNAGTSPPIGVVKSKVTSGVVYLMGRVTEREGDDVAKIASQVNGVQGVVKVYDYISESSIDASQKPVPVIDDTNKKP